MTTEDYAAAIQGAHTLRMLAKQIDQTGALDQALDHIERADSLGAVLHPTAYRDGVGRMHEDRDTLNAVRQLARLGTEAVS